MALQILSNLTSTRSLRKKAGPRAVAISPSTAQTGAVETAAQLDNKDSIPAGSLRVGQVIDVDVMGVHTATTGTEDHTMALMFGTQALFTSAAIDPATSDLFWFKGTITIRTIGASGTAFFHGFFAKGPSGTGTLVPIYLAEFAIDTTIARVLAIQIDRQASATDGDSCRQEVGIYDVRG